MATFWSLFGKSVIMSGFVCIVTVSTLCYLAICGAPIPEILVNITIMIVSFFFGSKVQNNEPNKPTTLEVQ